MGLTVGAVCALDISDVNMQFLEIRNNSVHQHTDTGQESISGFLDPIEERVAEGLEVHDWTVVLEPSISDLDTLLPLLGFTQSPTDTFTMTDTIPSFTTKMLIGTKYHTYSGCYVEEATFRHARGSHPLRLEMRVFATSDTLADSGSIATLVDAVGYPFPQLTATLAGQTHTPDRVALGFKNHLVREWNNSSTPTAICPGRREAYIATSTPYYSSNEKALFSAPAAPAVDGAAAVIAWTRATRSTTFTYYNVKLLPTPPSIKSKDEEVRLDQYYKAYRAVASPVCVCTHDATV